MPVIQNGPNAEMTCANYNVFNGQPLNKATDKNIFGGSNSVFCFLYLVYIVYTARVEEGASTLVTHKRIIIPGNRSINAEGGGKGSKL